MTPRRLAILGPPLAALGALAAISAAAPSLALVNESPSLPKGLYVRAAGAAPEPGAVVAFAQPADARPYLAALGVPADVSLLKRVAGRGGHLVCAERERVALPGRWAPAMSHDRRGVALPRWRACRALADDEVFLLGDSAESFDSRYFGPVRRADLDGVYREVLTW
ncbi:S26 family signal peptidase [Phenylobacterium terrae]|uniref:S26 family signal peptidase n=1 Tax=Phenylobacterium terrae TaxID=2665495 RepID=A0ABW4N6Y2_9CAUL